MKNMIYCERTANGMHSFYLVLDGNRYFLLSQKYRKGVHKYYSEGVHITQAFNFSKSNEDCALIRTMEKLPMYIKYVEKESGIEVLNKTKKKNSVMQKKYKKSTLTA